MGSMVAGMRFPTADPVHIVLPDRDVDLGETMGLAGAFDAHLGPSARSAIAKILLWFQKGSSTSDRGWPIIELSATLIRFLKALNGPFHWKNCKGVSNGFAE